MDWLAGWLREIVIVILFASFIDLLVPNNALQRYVKVALSLFILLTILSPLLRLLDSSFSLDRLAAEASVFQQGDGFRLVDDPSGGMPSLNAILQGGESLRQQNMSQASDVARSQLEEAVRTDMERRTGHSVRSVRADLAIGEDGEAVLHSIEVVLAPAEATEEAEAVARSSLEADARGERAIGQVEPIESVKPVIVQIGENADESGTEDAGGTVLSKELEESRVRWERELKENWGQTDTSVAVRFAEADRLERG